MIVRPIREDENRKLRSVSSIAFSYSCDLEQAENDKVTGEVFGAFLDDGETLAASVHPCNYESIYNDTYLPHVGIAGVASLPEYRRGGCVRAIFDELFRIAPERGWATSYLYPFSYEYYRKFGYERIVQLMSLKIQPHVLNCVERNTDAVLYQGDEKQMQVILDVYHTYAERFNLMFRRKPNFRELSPKPHKTQLYTYFTPKAYATVKINGAQLEIDELAYVDADGLLSILGFLRMFEGQVHEFIFRRLPMDSELNYIFTDYNGCEYMPYNTGMGRVILIEKLLNVNKYPQEHGHFSLKVEDCIDYNRCIFDVEYENGVAEVKKRNDGNYDVKCAAPSLSRIMYGADEFTTDKLQYMPDVEIAKTSGTESFLRAFPKKRLCLFDRF